MENREQFGRLITPDTKLQRSYFKQMVDLLGVYVKFYAPKDSKSYSLQGELMSKYKEPVKVGSIFSDYIDQQTAKMLGWNSELQTEASIIHLPYDLEGLEVGALVEVPSALENAKSRKFRISKMSVTPIYPASVACELVQEYESVMETAQTEHFKSSNFNLLWDGDGSRNEL